jgi:orotidine-5'-phosphate decarboxylase
MLSFTERLRRIQHTRNSVLCVGLDPDPGLLPKHLLKNDLPDAVLAFNCAIIEATGSMACAFKINFAFFEVMGREGWRVLEETRRAIPDGVLAIADAKRGDIGNSARFYAKSVFEDLNFDACTVSPYMGRDSVEPFLQYPDRAAFILARTSNPGSADFQEKDLNGRKLYQAVAETVAQWGREMPGDAGLVVGATSPESLAALRSACPTLPFLIPGLGAQGGDATAVMRHAETADGPVIVNSSRAVLYASSGLDFAEAAARQAEAARATLEKARITTA